MFPRERVLASLNHEEPDRVPIDIGGVMDLCFTRSAYENIKKYLKQPIEDVGFSVFWTTAVYPDEKLLESLEVDCRSVYIPDAIPEIQIKPDGASEYVDVYGQRRRESKRGYAWDVIDFPLSGDISIKDIERFHWDVIDMNSFIKLVDKAVERAKKLQEETRFAVVANYACSPMTFTQLLRGFDTWCTDLIDNPNLIEAMMDCYISSVEESYKCFFSRVWKYVDVVFGLGDDVATQNSLFMSIEHYKKYVKPRHARVIELCRKYTDAPFIYHCCGAMSEIIPDLIEIGVDAINPVQVNSKGMDTKNLKQEYGKDITFWGAIDTSHVLPHGTRHEVDEEVKKRVKTLGKNGGYVAGAVHNIQPDVPPENVFTMVKAVKKYGKLAPA